MTIYIKFGVNCSISLASGIFYSQRGGAPPLDPPVRGKGGFFFFEWKGGST